MGNLTIENFWGRRLSVTHLEDPKPIRGWSFSERPLNSFLEAPLERSSEFGDGDPSAGPVILVSAAGAVGKSTLAKQISAQTGAVYVDLAVSDPVGGNTLSGGLAKAGLYTAWTAGNVAILLDGLDEARLRVTQEAFAAFLADVVEVSRDRQVPTILFGRTGAVQDAWLLLTEYGVDAPVLEIGLYDHQSAIGFAMARLRTQKTSTDHVVPERKAIELILGKIRSTTERDGDRFAG